MFAWLGRLLAGVFGIKFFMGTLLMTILGVVLYNGLVDIVQEVFNFAISQAGGNSPSSITSPTITGFAGWFLANLYVPETFAVVITCVVIRFTLRKIPFLNW
jgi:multisubunit Na+/H+ antiporter MnhC subunit